MMIRRKHLVEFKYKEYLRFSQDWDLFLRLYENGFSFVNTTEVLYIYIIDIIVIQELIQIGIGIIFYKVQSRTQKIRKN